MATGAAICQIKCREGAAPAPRDRRQASKGDPVVIEEGLHGDERGYGRGRIARPLDTAWVCAFGVYDPAGRLGAPLSTPPKLRLTERLPPRASRRGISPRSRRSDGLSPPFGDGAAAPAPGRNWASSTTTCSGTLASGERTWLTDSRSRSSTGTDSTAQPAEPFYDRSLCSRSWNRTVNSQQTTLTAADEDVIRAGGVPSLPRLQLGAHGDHRRFVGVAREDPLLCACPKCSC